MLGMFVSENVCLDRANLTSELHKPLVKGDPTIMLPNNELSRDSRRKKEAARKRVMRSV
jgi:hypothetical protein